MLKQIYWQEQLQCNKCNKCRRKPLRHSPQNLHIVHILISLAESTRHHTSHWIVSSILEVYKQPRINKMDFSSK